jgi:hypothetical protein
LPVIKCPLHNDVLEVHRTLFSRFASLDIVFRRFRNGCSRMIYRLTFSGLTGDSIGDFARAGIYAIS